MSEFPVIQAPAGGLDRLRLSAWADPMFFLNTVDAVDAQGVKFKKAVKVNGEFLRKDAALPGKGLLDDISLLKTYRNDENMNVVWDVNIGSTPADRLPLYQGMIEECHSKGIQCLVGFAQAEPGPKTTALNNWLANPVTPSINTFADQVVSFAMTNFPQCDGISMDIEGLGAVNTAQRDTIKANLTQFYQRVATQIGADRIVGIACGGLISPTVASRLFTHSAQNQKSEIPGTRTSAMTNAIVHAYEIALTNKNILMRPMAYDNFGTLIGKADAMEQAVFDWHEDILDFALNTVKLSPSRFQLGVKTVIGKKGGEVPNPNNVQKRCRTILRQNRVGLIFFPVSERFWGGCAQALNPQPNVASPRTKGFPVQMPFDDKAATRLPP